MFLGPPERVEVFTVNGQTATRITSLPCRVNLASGATGEDTQTLRVHGSDLVLGGSNELGQKMRQQSHWHDRTQGKGVSATRKSA